MTPEERHLYNLYHREYQRARYHALSSEERAELIRRNTAQTRERRARQRLKARNGRNHLKSS